MFTWKEFLEFSEWNASASSADLYTGSPFCNLILKVLQPKNSSEKKKSTLKLILSAGI